MASDEAVIRAYLTATADLRRRVEAAVRRIWGALPSYNRSDIDAWLTAVVPIAQAAQERMGALTDGYLSSLARTAPVGVPAETLATSRGVPLRDLYERPFVEVWTRLGAGADLASAATAGGDRAVLTLETDMQLAMKLTAGEFQSARPQVTRFRRVLSGGGSCQLCQTAAEQTYSTADLMPIHSRCGCGIAPITSEGDPAGAMNRRTIDASETGDGSERPGLAVHTHGELGPVLTPEGEHFTGPGQV